MLLPPRIALWVVAALSCGGCTLAAQVTGTSVIQADEHGGTVAPVTNYTKAGAMNMANAWCGRYSLVAVETRVIFMTDGMDFDCVRPPT